MPTTLTTPIETPSITEQNVRRFTLDLDLNTLSYTVINKYANGKLDENNIHTETFTVLNPDGTAHSDIMLIKASLKDILTKAIIDARKKGNIGAGTDTEDIP
jgi:hypothetical protein